MADEALTTARLKTPSAAAIAGLLFSVLLVAPRPIRDCGRAASHAKE